MGGASLRPAAYTRARAGCDHEWVTLESGKPGDAFRRRRLAKHFQPCARSGRDCGNFRASAVDVRASRALLRNAKGPPTISSVDRGGFGERNYSLTTNIRNLSLPRSSFIAPTWRRTLITDFVVESMLRPSDLISASVKNGRPPSSVHSASTDINS